MNTSQTRCRCEQASAKNLYERRVHYAPDGKKKQSEETIVGDSAGRALVALVVVLGMLITHNALFLLLPGLYKLLK